MEIKKNEYDVQEYTVSDKPIWNPKYFFIMTIIFSYIPISIFYIINYNRFNDRKKRNKSIFIILIATIVMLLGFFYIQNETINRIFSLGIMYGLGYYMKLSQEDMYKRHIEGGGKSAKFLLPIILSLIFISIIIWLLVITANIPDKYINFLDDEIYYTDNVSTDDVQKLGDFLIEIQYFEEDNMRTSVKIDAVDNIYKVYFVVIEEAANDEKVIEAFVYLRNELQQRIYQDSREVEVYLCDDYLNVIKQITP